MLGSSVEVWTKNILYRFIEGQTHFGMPRGDKMSLALNKAKHVACHSNSFSTSKYAPRVERNYWYCIQNNQWKIIEDKLPMSIPVELKRTLLRLVTFSWNYLIVVSKRFKRARFSWFYKHYMQPGFHFKFHSRWVTFLIIWNTFFVADFWLFVFYYGSLQVNWLSTTSAERENLIVADTSKVLSIYNIL